MKPAASGDTSSSTERTLTLLEQCLSKAHRSCVDGDGSSATSTGHSDQSSVNVLIKVAMFCKADWESRDDPVVSQQQLINLLDFDLFVLALS